MHDASEENVVFPYKGFPSVLFSNQVREFLWKKRKTFS